MLYLVCYDEAAEERVIFTTCNKELADEKLAELQKTKASAFLIEFPFEKDCDELLAMYHE